MPIGFVLGQNQVQALSYFTRMKTRPKQTGSQAADQGDVSHKTWRGCGVKVLMGGRHTFVKKNFHA